MRPTTPIAMRLSRGAREESGNVTDDTDRLGRGGDSRVKGRLGGNRPYLEEQFAPASLGVAVIGVNIATVCVCVCVN